MARVDPFPNFNFYLEIDGITQAGFAQVSGFASRVEPFEYREGGDAASVRKLAGRTSYPDITLRWGLTSSTELYEWHARAVAGRVERKNGSIVLLDADGQEKARWNFYAAWPTEIRWADLDAKGNDAAIASLTVTCERLEQA